MIRDINGHDLKVSAVIVAGGKGRRMGAGINKVFLPIAGETILSRTVGCFERCAVIDEIVIVTSADDIRRVREITGEFSKVKSIVRGGRERQESVYNGLRAANGNIAAIHDGARCLINESIIENTVADCVRYGAAAAGVTVKDTLKAIDENGFIVKTIDRAKTVQIQTPQVFYSDQIKKLHKKAIRDGLAVTDDCAILEAYGGKIHVTSGSYDNIKITSPADIAIGEGIIAKSTARRKDER